MGNSDTGGQGEAVDGIDCLPSMPDDYHVHTHLSIFLNGEALAVPQNIGIVDSDTAQCFYSIHTHDATGKLHIEAAAAGKFTLGQFFRIWGRTFSNIEVGGLVGMPIVVYVTDPDGKVTEIPDDQWQDIELLSHREITIQIGSAITEIPNFTWDGP
jgi:hypothetical protein